jgi:hypothetical protein
LSKSWVLNLEDDTISGWSISHPFSILRQINILII